MPSANRLTSPPLHRKKVTLVEGRGAVVSGKRDRVLECGGGSGDGDDGLET